MVLLGQILMCVTIVLMITGRTPLYVTAIVGSTLAAVIAGIPLSGKEAVTVAKMVNGGLNPVIADMAGVLMFIGVMEVSGFLDVIIKTLIRLGRIIGGGPGVAAAGGIAAGIIGALTGFTQPVITGAITGPAAVKLGVDPSKAAGITAHAGHLGNFAGFTHPTQVAVIATAGIKFGAINLAGLVTALSVFAVSYFRLRAEENNKAIKLTPEEIERIAAEYETIDKGVRPIVAFSPFLVLVVGFVLGLPIFIVGIVSGIITIILARMAFGKGETAMLAGVGKIATPLVATIGFLFMAAVIQNIGLVDIVSKLFEPATSVAPIQVMLLVSVLTGLFTQSNGASAAVVVPMLAVVLKAGADPLTAAIAAAGGCAMMQYFLTGGPVAALATVIPVIPGSELKAANKFQRPAILFGVLVVFIITLILSFVR